jgi:hypothetical protein
MQKRSSIIGGLILIIAGVFFLLLQMAPDLLPAIDMGRQWPLIVIGVGVLLGLGALLGAPPLAIPGAIVSGIGGILYYQNLTGNWETWAFVWALIPGFVGLGMIGMGVLDRDERDKIAVGVRLFLISLAIFILFAVMFTSLGVIEQFWPILLILTGLWFLVRSRRRKG